MRFAHKFSVCEKGCRCSSSRLTYNNRNAKQVDCSFDTNALTYWQYHKIAYYNKIYNKILRFLLSIRGRLGSITPLARNVGVLIG